MTHPSRTLIPIALLALTLAIAGCAAAPTGAEPTDAAEPSLAAPSDAPPSAASSEGAAATEAPEAEPVAVMIDDPDFIPEMLTVAVGTEVTWLNADPYEHTVTEGTDGDAVDDPFVDEDVPADGTVSLRFDEPGTYEITCQIHPTMQMTVIVEG